MHETVVLNINIIIMLMLPYKKCAWKRLNKGTVEHSVTLQ